VGLGGKLLSQGKVLDDNRRSALRELLVRRATQRYDKPIGTLE
jgi:hypothetical protein